MLFVCRWGITTSECCSRRRSSSLHTGNSRWGCRCRDRCSHWDTRCFPGGCSRRRSSRNRSRRCRWCRRRCRCPCSRGGRECRSRSSNRHRPSRHRRRIHRSIIAGAVGVTARRAGNTHPRAAIVAIPAFIAGAHAGGVIAGAGAMAIVGTGNAHPGISSLRRPSLLRIRRCRFR